MISTWVSAVEEREHTELSDAEEQNSYKVATCIHSLRSVIPGLALADWAGLLRGRLSSHSVLILPATRHKGCEKT